MKGRRTQRASSAKGGGHRSGRSERRSSHPQAALSGLQQELALQLTVGCIAALRQFGLTDAQLRRVLDAALAPTAAPATDLRIHEDVVLLGDLMADWTESSAYLDKSGRPSTLRVAGRAPSFAALVRRHFPRRSIESVLGFALAARTLERLPDNRVAPLGSCVILVDNPALMMAHAVRSVRWFLSGMLHNRAALARGEPPWPERQAYATLPEAQFAEFVRCMRQPINNLVEISDRWLREHASQPVRGRGHRASRRITVGMHAFVFRDANSW